MTLFFRLIFAGLALTFLHIAPATAYQGSDAQKQAIDLARLVHPTDLAVTSATEGMDRYFIPAMLKQPEIAAMEEEHPGILKAMYQAARPFMIEGERRNAVKAQEGLAAIYTAELSAAEISELHRFFSSPTGQKVIRGMFNPAAVGNTIEAIAADPEGDISAATLNTTHAQAIGHMVSTMSAEDEEAAAAFVATPTGAKMRALHPKVQALILELANADHPDLQRQVDAAMLAAAEAHQATSPDN